MSPRIVYSTDPEPPRPCPRCGRTPCVCRADGSPASETVHIRVERKGRAGKTVTVISGLQRAPGELKQILSALQTACGAGGAISGDALEVQGDQRERVAAVLRTLACRVR